MGRRSPAPAPSRGRWPRILGCLLVLLVGVALARAFDAPAGSADVLPQQLTALPAQVQRTVTLQVVALQEEAARTLVQLPPATPSPQADFQVCVTRAGRVVPKAWIELGWRGFEGGTSSHTLEQADEQGCRTLALPEGELELVAWSGDGLSERWSGTLQGSGPERVQLELKPTAELAGRVVDARSHQPIAAARVRLWTSSELDEVRSAGDGSFRWPRVPQGGVWEQLRIEAQGYASSVHCVRAISASSAEYAEPLAGAPLQGELCIELLPALRLSGCILDAQGAPIQGARVRAEGYARILPSVASPDCTDGVSDAQGNFELRGLRPDLAHQLSVEAAGFASDARICDGAGACELALGEWRLETEQRLCGVVLDAEGWPVAGLRVELRSDQPESVPLAKAIDPGSLSALEARLTAALARRQCMTNDLGLFEFDGLRAGSWRLRARRDGAALLGLNVALLSGEQLAPLELQLAPECLVLEGRVLDARGPICNAEVELLRFGPAGRVHTDQQGRFRIAGLDSRDSYSLRARVRGPGGGWLELQQETRLPSAALELWLEPTVPLLAER